MLGTTSLGSDDIDHRNSGIVVRLLARMLRRVQALAQSSLKSFVEGAKEGFGLAAPADLQEIADRQAKALRTTACALSVCGTNAIVLVMVDFGLQAGRGGVINAVGIVGTYLTWIALVYLSSGQRWFVRASIALMILQGSLWGMMEFRLAEIADAQQAKFVIAMILGLVSTPILSAPFSVAMAFWFPVAIGGGLAVTEGLQDRDYYLASTIIGYELLVLVGMIVINRTLMQLSIARLRLRAQNETVGLLLKDYEESASDWLWETDGKLRLRGVTARFAQVLRLAAGDLEGRTLCEALGLKPDSHPGCEAGTMLEAMKASVSFRDLQVHVHIGGEDKWLSFTGRTYASPGRKSSGFRGVGSDITAKKRIAEETEYLASHDGLTGIGNRRMLVDCLDRACSGPGDASMQSFALLLLDLDRFKEVNDDHGHGSGDVVLLETAGRLSQNTRPGDVIARLGGDEFALMLPNTGSMEAKDRAERLIKDVSQPIQIGDTWLDVGASVGIALCPSNGRTAVEVMRNADLALYRAKETGRGVSCTFDASLAAELQDKVLLLSDLRQAIENEHTQIFYQPIVDIASRKVVSMEALCRWTHPERGPIPPLVFIPLAEECGLIRILGKTILLEACQAASRWSSSVSVSVNISPVQLKDPMMATIIADVLSETNLDPTRLELEITESTLLKADKQTRQHLLAIRKLGIRLILDDFGTGFSSLSTIRNFEFQGLKIDAEFARDVETDPKAEAILRMVSVMANELGVSLTVEGIESEGQLNLVRALGIARAQGYLLGRPSKLAASDATVPVLATA